MLLTLLNLAPFFPMRVHSKDCPDMIKHMVDALGVKSALEPTKATDIVHQMVQGDLPPATPLPLLPARLNALKGA